MPVADPTAAVGPTAVKSVARVDQSVTREGDMFDREGGRCVSSAGLSVQRPRTEMRPGIVQVICDGVRMFESDKMLL